MYKYNDQYEHVNVTHRKCPENIVKVESKIQKLFESKKLLIVVLNKLREDEFV